MENLRLLESVATIVVSIAAGYGLLLVVWRFLFKFYQTYSVVSDLHREFGPSPVGELLAVLRAIEASHGEIEIRQRLAERHLEFGVFVSTVEGNWTWANAWLCESFGLDSSELRDNGWVSALKDSEQVEEYRHWLGCIDENLHYERTYTIESHNRKTKTWRAGSEAWPVTDRDGKLICYVGYVVDAARKEKYEGKNYGPYNDPTDP